MKFPGTWQTSALENIADIGSGITKGRKAKGPTRRVPYLRVANVQAGRIDLTEVKDIEATDEEIERFGLEQDDILMTEGGDPDKLGRGALWDGRIHPCIHQNHIFRVRLEKESVYPPYFARVLGTRWAVDYFLKAAKQTTGIATINKTQLRGFPVPLPPLPEQKRIAAILDKADAIRRKRQEAIRLTEELLRSAFLEMFGDPVTNPKGWEVKKLGEVATITTGNTPSRANESNFGDAIEWIKTDNINTPGHYLTRSSEGLSEGGRRLGRSVGKGSTLMTCIAGSANVIGNVAIADRDVAFNQQINAVTPRGRLNEYYLYGALLLSKTAVQRLSTGGMKGLVSKCSLSKLAIPLPALDLQARFGAFFLRYSNSATRATAGVDTAAELQRALTWLAFSGRLQ